MKHKVLVIDDEFVMRDSIALSLRKVGYEVIACATGKEGITKVTEDAFSVAVIDYKLTDMDGLKLLKQLKDSFPDLPVIMITGFGSTDAVISAMQLGAHTFIDKPIPQQKLETEVKNAIESAVTRRELEYLKTKELDQESYYWGKSKVMRQLLEYVKKIADSDLTCLIFGENGSGKEMVARTIHSSSHRKENPFVCVNCPALSAGLLESELFGHEKGAFTGADAQRKGRFEFAHTGTILLDEISEVDLNLQAKLLRVLQERSFERVGSSVTRKVDVRVIATTNKNLQEEMRKGKFREDLYHRLNVLPVRVPSLREHKEDISDLLKFFLHLQNKVKLISDDALDAMVEYNWPGNVRELKNIVERAVQLADGDRITLPLIKDWLKLSYNSSSNSIEQLVGMPLETIEKKLIELNLKHFDGNKEKTANVLGISSRTLRNKLKLYSLKNE